MIILWSFLILGVVGIVFGLALAIAGKIFYVKEDNRKIDIARMLPNYNCGACGCAGCQGFAEKIVKGEVKNLSQCKPGKPDKNFNQIIEYLNNNPNDDGTVIKVNL